MDRRILPITPGALALLMLGAFLGGVFLERFNLLPGSASAPVRVGRTFAPFWETWRLVERNYVDRGKVDSVAMTRGAIEGMLDSLGDVGHTTYLSPEEARRLADNIEGKLEGIGATMTLRKGLPTVQQTLPGSPARKAGLKPGDALLEVNGKAVATLPLDRVVAMVRGPDGTKVKLRVIREGETKPLDFEITRARLEIPFVSWSLLPGVPIAHIALREFGAKADEQLRAAREEARKKGAHGAIIDVRGNPGGLKSQAVAVTSQFLAKGNVFLEKDAKGRETAIPVEPDGVAPDLPIIVLIDQGTGSSAEIFAGALQDYQRAQLVGTKTVGTGTVLAPFQLGDGSVVLLAVLEWYTPRGRQIWHKGIEPDKEVKLPEGATILLPEEEHGLTEAELQRSEDQQLLMALDLLRRQLSEREKKAARAAGLGSNERLVRVRPGDALAAPAPCQEDAEIVLAQRVLELAADKP